MIDFWTTRKSDIICELYKSTSTANARDRLQAVMDDFGALTTIEEGLINLVLSNAVLSTLFFDTDAVIAFIDGFTPTFDCDTCEPDCPNFDGVYYYPCEAKAWCEIATVGEWVAFDITNVTGVPDGLEGYFTRQALGLPDGDCLGDAGQMYLLLDFGLETTGHRLQALTRGNMTNRLPTVSWSNDPAAFGDPAHASWNNPSGNDNWYTAGASLTWSSELQSLNNPYRYVRLKMGAEAGDANGVQLFIDAVRNNPS
jgi:hypothetical protein